MHLTPLVNCSQLALSCRSLLQRELNKKRIVKHLLSWIPRCLTLIDNMKTVKDNRIISSDTDPTAREDRRIYGQSHDSFMQAR